MLPRPSQLPTFVVTVAEMQAIEAASERAGVSTDTLMENAGLACARRIREVLGGAAARNVIILVGPGNNGADGLVVARHLQRWGADVCCYVVRGRPSVDPKMVDARAYGVRVVDAAEDVELERLGRLLGRCDVLVDAILGAGRYRPLEGVVRDVALSVTANRSRHGYEIISLDLPTGVNPDIGEADEASLQADETLALCCPKVGIANFPGSAFAGRISILDIGLPDGLLEGFNLPQQWLTADVVAGWLPPRPLQSHKGTFGHLLIVAGSRHFVGAAYLAAQGAHRAGAGLVTLAAPESVYRLAAVKLTETIHLPLPEDAAGQIDPAAADEILPRLGSYSAMALGCGMGWLPGTTEFVERLLLNGAETAKIPLVIDADGLNNLSQRPDWANRLRAPAVLTPHPGEMATLTGLSTADVQSGRTTVATDAARRWNQHVLLKGANSIVAAPDGRSRLLPFINPALAAGGTGDVLTGIIGGLMAQGATPFDAASLGGFIHGTAGEEVRRIRGDAGVVASDLLDRVPSMMAGLRAR
jgi:NAD(P)H-hydrate epimerase